MFYISFLLFFPFFLFEKQNRRAEGWNEFIHNYWHRRLLRGNLIDFLSISCSYVDRSHVCAAQDSCCLLWVRVCQFTWEEVTNMHGTLTDNIPYTADQSRREFRLIHDYKSLREQNCVTAVNHFTIDQKRKRSNCQFTLFSTVGKTC